MKRLLLLVLSSLFAWACTDVGAGPPEDPLDNYIESDDPLATEVVALSFVAYDTQTACGQVTGIRVVVADQDETLTCVSLLAPALVSDPYTTEEDQGRHYVADCFFVVAPGEWQVVSVEAIGVDGEPLPCCSAEFPELLVVTSGATTELGVEIQCELVGPGALDIYGWLERPPIIKDLDIFPSKFGGPCVPRFLRAEAYDREGDAFTYDWEVIDSPLPYGFNLWEHGPFATFMAFPGGDYMLRLIVTDEHGMSTHLDFPIHVTEPLIYKTLDEDSGRPCYEIEPEAPAELP
ncbi:MAG: hypothetical protein IT385_03945 [Deltaproteobacteria bacterium]|nr:hypothetical protein [Deltaproteobacteria bacterium]